MIIGIGTDIIEIDRIGKAIERNSNFLKKNFTSAEYGFFISKNLKIESIAGTFSAKEAVSKAIGTGFRGFGLVDIEILRDNFGKPYINVDKKIEGILSEKGITNYKFHLSISHNKNTAIAYVILEGDLVEVI